MTLKRLLRHDTVKRRRKRVTWLTPKKIAFLLGIFTFVLILEGYAAQHGMRFRPEQLFVDLWANIGAGLAEIVITVLVIDALNQRQSTEVEKNAVILQMGSPDNAFAIEAVRILRARSWLLDGSLVEAYLSKANLYGANLINADLENAILIEAQLQNTDLINANLRNASLLKANLSGAKFSGTDLRGSNLKEAILSGAANFSDAKFDTETVLPDGNYWSLGYDVRKYERLRYSD